MIHPQYDLQSQRVVALVSAVLSFTAHSISVVKTNSTFTCCVLVPFAHSAPSTLAAGPPVRESLLEGVVAEPLVPRRRVARGDHVVERRWQDPGRDERRRGAVVQRLAQTTPGSSASCSEMLQTVKLFDTEAQISVTLTEKKRCDNNQWQTSKTPTPDGPLAQIAASTCLIFVDFCFVWKGPLVFVCPSNGMMKNS